MQCIQKITLSLLAVAAVSTFNSSYASTLEVNFTDGAVMAGHVSGKVKFVGTGHCEFSGSASSDVELSSGTVKASDASSFGGHIYMTGGHLEAVLDFTLPTLHVNAPGTLTSLAGGDDDSSSTMDINIVHGTGHLTLAGAGDVKISGSMRNNTGGVSSSVVDQAISFVSASRLPNANNSFVGDVNLISAPGLLGGVQQSYDSAGQILSTQTIKVAANFGGSATAEVKASYFAGTVKAHKINIGGHDWKVPVTAQ
jgi:hypothetical protein